MPAPLKIQRACLRVGDMRHIILLLLLASPVLAAGALYERVGPEKLPALERAFTKLDRPAIKDWLLSLEQTEIYLKLTKEAEPAFQAQAALPVSAEQLAAARGIVGAALAG